MLKYMSALRPSTPSAGASAKVRLPQARSETYHGHQLCEIVGLQHTLHRRCPVSGVLPRDSCRASLASRALHNSYTQSSLPACQYGVAELGLRETWLLNTQKGNSASRNHS